MQANRSSHICAVGGNLGRPLVIALEKSDASFISAAYKDCSKSAICES
eukprot:Gb_00627 [translate_table: standard]